VDAATGRGEITGGVDSTFHRPSSLPSTKQTSAIPTARGNLLDNLVDDKVPITSGLADDLQGLASQLEVTRKTVAYLDNLIHQ
jgi:hypothetical protein